MKLFLRSNLAGFIKKLRARPVSNGEKLATLLLLHSDLKVHFAMIT